MLAACIDIGSNTTRLLVAERRGGRLVSVHEQRSFTRVGHGRSAGDPIPPQKISDVVEVVRAQLAAARAQGAGEVHVIATAAVRSAPNGRELAQALSRHAGIPVRILSEQEEARLAFTGAASMLRAGGHVPLAVVDVGGGSSEIAVGTPAGGVEWWASLPVGSADLTDRYLASDPPTEAELTAARREVDDRLAGLRPPRPARAVAVGGSATSLRRLAGPRLDATALSGALGLLTSAGAHAVAAANGIDPQRARLLPAGLTVLRAVGEMLETPLEIGLGGIREGVLLEADLP